MTRDEAIKLIEHIGIAFVPTDQYGDYDDTQPYAEAIDLAIESLSADEEEENGTFVNRDNCNFNCNDSNRTLVEVVRCKDCRHRYISGNGTTNYYVCDFMDAQYTDDGYCHHGERRE